MNKSKERLESQSAKTVPAPVFDPPTRARENLLIYFVVNIVRSLYHLHVWIALRLPYLANFVLSVGSRCRFGSYYVVCNVFYVLEPSAGPCLRSVFFTSLHFGILLSSAISFFLFRLCITAYYGGSRVKFGSCRIICIYKI